MILETLVQIRTTQRPQAQREALADMRGAVLPGTVMTGQAMGPTSSKRASMP